jgi:hypothetical protein
MEELELIVQKMMDAGESEEAIAEVIRTYESKKVNGSTATAANVGPVQDAAKPKVGELISEGTFSDLEKVNKTRETFGYKPLKSLPNDTPVSVEDEENIINYIDDKLIPGTKYVSEIKDEVKESYDKAKANAPKSDFGTLDFNNEKAIKDFDKNFTSNFFKNNKIVQEQIIPIEKENLEPKLKDFVATTKKQMGLDIPENVTQEKIDELQNKVQSWYNNNLNKAVSKNPEYNRVVAAFNSIAQEIREPELNRYLKGKDSPTLLKVMDTAENLDKFTGLPIAKIANYAENIISSGRGISNSLAKTGVSLGLADEVEKEEIFERIKKEVEQYGNENTQGAWIVDKTDVKNSWKFIPKQDLYGSGNETLWRAQVAGKDYKEGSFKEFEKQFQKNNEEQYNKIGSKFLELQDEALAIEQWNDNEFDEVLKGNDVVSNLIGLAADQLPQMGLSIVTLGISSGAQIGGDIYAEGIDIEAAKRFNLKEGEIPSVEQRAEILRDKDFINSLEAKAIGGGFVAGQLERFGAGKTIKAFTNASAKSILRGGYKSFLKSVANGAIANTQTGATEAITEVLQEVIQASASGAEVDPNQLFEAGGTGFLVSAVTGIGGNIKSQSIAEVKSASRMIAGKLNDQSTEALFNAKLKEIDLSIKESNDPEVVADLENKKEVVLETRNANMSLPKEFTTKNKEKAIDLIIEKNKLTKEIEGKTPELVEDKKEKINNINESLKKIAIDNTKSVETDKAIDKAKKILKKLDINSELNVVEASEASSTKEQIASILKKAGRTEDQINKRIKEYESGFGFFITDSNNPNKEYLVLNKNKMEELGITTTAQHELLHKILKNRLANDPNATKQMYESLQSEVAKLDKDVAKAFNGIMEKYMSDVENPNINYNLNNYYEEYFVQFSEFAANNLDKINNNVFIRIKDFIRRIFNKIGFTNIDFDEQGAINFIKDYNREFKKGKLSKATIKLANQNIKATKNKEVADVFSKSIDIDANTKSDIFTRANNVYEEYKDDPSSAGLMVGLEFEPIVKKMLNKYRDLFGMDEYTLDLIANDVMIETRPGYNGIPALVRTWDPAKGASLTSHIYGNLPKRILGIIQNKYPDLGRTVELVQEKADKLTTDEGFGGTGEINDGFVDTSSHENYTRVSRKKAEVKMGMPPEYAKRSEEIGERILMSTKLQDLDAKIVGTIKDSEGRTLRVAMLESNKARVYLPDGTTEIIKARTPKVVEQKYGAAERSFKKIASTKAQMIEEAKAYLIPEMEKAAGGLKDNYEPTLQYTEFIDKTFSLYKDYLSQSAINKRFADFKEPVIDPKTGKQAREKTAQGNKIFTKRPLALAEWRKYFIGDGTKRIDGRRRSLLEALATEQGFDKVMEVLGKEDMRKQIESRQEELSNDLIDNYVAVLAKSLDRNNPTVAFSKFTKELAALINKTQAEVENELVLWHSQGKTFSDLPEDNELKNGLREMLEAEYPELINLSIEEKGELITSTETYMYNVLNPIHTYPLIKRTEMNANQIKEYLDGANELVSFFPRIFSELGFGENKTVVKKSTITNRFLSRFLGFDSHSSTKIFFKEPSNTDAVIDQYDQLMKGQAVFGFNKKENANGSILYTNKGNKVVLREKKIKGAKENETKYELVPQGLTINRDLFNKHLASKNNEVGSKFENLKELNIDLYNEGKALEKRLNNVYDLSKYYRELNVIYREVVADPKATTESIRNAILKNKDLLENYKAEQKLRDDFFKYILNTLKFLGNKKRKESQESFDKFMQSTVIPFFLDNSKLGFRLFSAKRYYSLLPFKGSKNDQHIKAKAIASAEFITAFINNDLSSSKIEEIMLNYESALGSGKAQDRADRLIGSTYYKDFAVKIGSEEDVKDRKFNVDYLKTVIDIFNPDKTLYDRYIERGYNRTVEGLKIDPKAEASNQEIIKATKNNEIVKQAKESNLGEVVANMIERKTGISAKAPLSASRAANIGKTKGKFNFYLPPNAEDFAGLLYKFYGKGKQGDKDMAFMKEHLLDPYNAGEQAISTYKQNLAEDYKSIEKQLGEIEGTVSKETKATLDELGFNADQAVRVALWNQAGFEIPGIQNIEAAKLRIAVIKDKRLKAYADGIKTIVKGNLFEPSEQWFSSNIRYDLFTHATEGVRPKFLEQWATNVKEIFNEENLIKLEAAYGKDYVKNLNDIIARMKTGKSRGSNLGKEANAALDYLNGSIGVIMWMNTRSAMLQTISAVNYINWSDNNPVRIAQALAKPKDFASTFMEIFNSDFLKQRRSGLEINVEEAEIARAVEKSKGKASKIFNALIKAGFKPTQIADSFAIAIGGTPLLMNRTKTYQRKGFEYAEAREKAFNDLREISEENQQSSRQDKVSNIQVGVMGRLVFAFNNTPFQMTRLQKKAALDLVNRRGDWKTNVSKLAYYSVLQSVIFYALQQGAALTLFGKDDEDLTEEERENIAKYKEKKVIGLTNSVVDGFLSGSGLPGKILVTGKNTLAKYLEEEKKGYKADYGDVLNEALSISPPVSSKFKKAYSAFNTFRYGSTKKGKADFEQYNKLSPLHPMNVARAKMFSAVTNIPLDRVVTKIDNLNEAVTNTDIEPQIKLALALGWGKWSLGFYDGLYGEDAKDAKSKKSSSTRKQKNREKALDLSKKSFRYRDSVRLANYRKKNKK